MLFTRKLLLGFVVSLTITSAQAQTVKPKQKNPAKNSYKLVVCETGDDKVYVVYSFDNGGGSAFTCMAAGSKDTEEGIVALRTSLEKRMKKQIVITQIAKLTS
jgi:hypothetical protein